MNSSLGMCAGRGTETITNINCVGRIIIILPCMCSGICGVIIAVTFRDFVQPEYHVGNEKTDKTCVCAKIWSQFQE